MRIWVLAFAMLAVLSAGCASRYERREERRQSYVDLRKAKGRETMLGSDVLESVNRQKVVNVMLPCIGSEGTCETYLSPLGITIGSVEVFHVVFPDGRVVRSER